MAERLIWRVVIAAAQALERATEAVQKRMEPPPPGLLLPADLQAKLRALGFSIPERSWTKDAPPFRLGFGAYIHPVPRWELSVYGPRPARFRGDSPLRLTLCEPNASPDLAAVATPGLIEGFDVALSRREYDGDGWVDVDATETDLRDARTLLPPGLRAQLHQLPGMSLMIQTDKSTSAINMTWSQSGSLASLDEALAALLALNQQLNVAQ